MVNKMVQLKKYKTIATGPVCPWKLPRNCPIGDLGDCTMSLTITLFGAKTAILRPFERKKSLFETSEV